MSTKECGVGTDPYAAPHHLMTSTPIKRPSKRRRVELEEEEDTLEGMSSMEIPEAQDDTYDPAASITALSESIDMRQVTQVCLQTVL